MPTVEQFLSQLEPVLTKEEAAELRTLITNEFPGLEMTEVAANTWRWAATGEGDPPQLHSTEAASATSLLDLFDGMRDTSRAKLVALARVKP